MNEPKSDARKQQLQEALRWAHEQKRLNAQVPYNLDSAIAGLKRELKQYEPPPTKWVEKRAEGAWGWLFFGLVCSVITLYFGSIAWQNSMDLWDKPRAMFSAADHWHEGWPTIPIMFFGFLSIMSFGGFNSKKWVKVVIDEE